jgi:hypothetical protein
MMMVLLQRSASENRDYIMPVVMGLFQSSPRHIYYYVLFTLSLLLASRLPNDSQEEELGNLKS